MHRFRDMSTYWSKIAENLPHSHLERSLGVTHCEFFDESYLATLPESEIMWLWRTFHDPAFDLLSTIPVCDRQTDGQTRHRRKDRAMHSVARVKRHANGTAMTAT